MRATGIIRRVDDLGRVAIPKEVRRILKIKDGEPLEIFIEDEMVCFKKYYPDGEESEATIMGRSQKALQELDYEQRIIP